MQCKFCGKTDFKKQSQQALAGHQRWCKQNPNSPKYEGPSGSKATTVAEDIVPPSDLPPQREKPQVGEGYPTLTDWRSAPPPPGAEPGPSEPGEPVQPGQREPAIFDTSGWWQGAGDFVDATLLKEKKAKVNVTKEKAKLLDGSLKQLGLVVEAPAQPFIIAYWVPFLLTIGSVFIFPILVAYAPDILKALPWFKKKEEEEPVVEVEEE